MLLLLTTFAMTSHGDWFAWVVAGALGGSITLVLAMAVARTYRGRGRPLSTRDLPHSALAATTAPPAAADAAPADGATPLVVTASTPTRLSADGMAGARSPSRLPAGSAVIGYITVAAVPGADEDGEPLAAIDANCERHGWKLLEIVRDREEGPALDRAGLGYALERIADRQAQGLVVSDLERLSHSIVDLGVLMRWFRDSRATLIALDLDIDTSTPEGRHVGSTLIALSAWEHERIANGTRRGLAKGRASGRPPGRPAVSHRPELVKRITAMRAANMSLRAIADQLNAEGVPTLRGGKQWWPSSIQTALGYRRPGRRDQLPSPHARAAP
jgi:DNA invertase Pin-like site-specific DNA recombinase